MLHATLIMAHKNKPQLIRLIKAISCPEIHVFVHLDKNWNLTETDLKEIQDTANNVYVIDKRIHGELDKWSLVQIAINLYKYALKKEQELKTTYNYFMLLSGQDYPIKSKQYILDFLSSQYPKPLIDIETFEENDYVRRKFVNTYQDIILDEYQTKYKNKHLVRKIKSLLPVLINRHNAKRNITPATRLTKLGIKMGIGSAWWILPREVIIFLEDFIKYNKKGMRILKKTITPEEHFFQGIVLTSPYANLVIENDDIYTKGDQQCMTYANFVTPTKPFRGHPHDILVEDFERIINKKALFARKFNIDTDSEVLDMIDAKILNQ